MDEGRSFRLVIIWQLHVGHPPTCPAHSTPTALGRLDFNIQHYILDIVEVAHYNSSHFPLQNTLKNRGNHIHLAF